MTSAYFASLMALPIVIDAPGSYLTRAGEAVTILRASPYNDFACAGQYPNGTPEWWHRSGRIFNGRETANDITAKSTPIPTPTPHLKVNMSNDHTTAPPTTEPTEVPFSEDTFKCLLGLDSNEAGEIRLRVGLTAPAIVANGNAPDLSDPAVFMAWWIQQNWDSLRNLAANEYNVRQSLAMVTQDSGLQLVSTDGTALQ